MNEKPSFGILSSFNKQEIKRLFRTAQTVYQTPGVIIKKAPKLGTFGRILIVTPKKAGTAPVRNLIRRRLKHIFFTNQLYEKPYDIIVLVAAPAQTLSFSTLQELLINLYDKKNTPH